MEPSNLRYGLLANHARLILKLDTVAVMPSLVGEGLVSFDEKQSVQSKTTDGEKTDALLTLLHRRAIADGSYYERFLTILADDYRSGGQHLEKLVSKIRQDSVDPDIVQRYQSIPSGLDPRQKSSLMAVDEQLISSLNVEDIIADLVSLGVLSLDENQVCTNLTSYCVHVYIDSMKWQCKEDWF